MGCLRVRTDSANARNSACRGSSGAVTSFSNPISGLRASRLDANAQRILAREIERDVLVLLEETHLADAFGGDAAGGDVGDGAGGKFDARVRDVHFIRDHRDADGFQIDHRRVDQREQDIEVVDHHVVDHIDIEAARRENPEAMDFEEHRPRNDALRGRDRRIESLDVTDLQDPRRALCAEAINWSASSIDAAIGFSTSTSRPASSRRQPIRACSFVGTARLTACDARGGERIDIGNHARAEFRGDLPRALGIRVHNAREFDAFELAPHADVVPAELAGTDDGNANGFLAHDFALLASAALGRERLNRDARFVRGANQGLAVEKQRAPAHRSRARWHCERRITSIVLRPDNRHIESHVLARLAHLDDHELLPAGDPRGALDGFVGAFHRLDGHARAVAHTTVWPRSRPAICARSVAPYAISAASASSGARRVRTPVAGSSDPRNFVESTSSMPSSSSTCATAPISESVFFDGSASSNFARRQSGRIELKILLCFTCPAITACFTPS